MQADKDNKLPALRFYNEWHELRVNLLLSANWLENEAKALLEPYNITLKQFNILRILRGHKGKQSLSILEVRQRMIDKMSDTSRILTRLDHKGLVIKEPCNRDKRTTRIKISPDGLSLLTDIDQQMTEMDRLVMKFEPEEAKMLIEMLGRLRK